MIVLNNTHQQEILIDLECPHCQKTIKAYQISDMPYPSYETNKEIESERHKRILIQCPKCSKDIHGDIFVSHKNIYLNIIDDQIQLSKGQDKNEIVKSGILFAILRIQNNVDEIIKAYNEKEEDKKLQTLAKELILSLRFLDISKEAYSIEEDIIDRLCDLYHKYKNEHWKEIELSTEAKDLRDNLISFVQDVSLLTDKWIDVQMRRILMN